MQYYLSPPPMDYYSAWSTSQRIPQRAAANPSHSKRISEEQISDDQQSVATCE